jgi:hypothetical protein
MGQNGKLWSRLLLALVFAPACQPACQRLCVENAEYVDACLEHWEALWPDFGYDDANGYIAACVDRVEATLALSPIEEQRNVRITCTEKLAQVASSVGCSDYVPNGADLDPTEGENGVIPRPQEGGP